MSRVTVLTMMRDEVPSLLEWVAFQQEIGVERIVVYTNDCRDGTDAMLVVQVDAMHEIGPSCNDQRVRNHPTPKSKGLGHL